VRDIIATLGRQRSGRNVDDRGMLTRPREIALP
jgi:hypothetical protein